MKRLLGVTLAGVMLFGMLTGCEGSGSGSGEAVSVEPVSMIVDVGSVGLADRYAGMVVSGETADVKRDSDKTVLEIYVEEGDMVQAGEALFAYDSEKIQLDLDTLYLEVERYDNTIAAAKSEIKVLEKQLKKAKSSEKLSYTLQIDSRQADIREAEYNKALKERDIAAKEAALQNTTVLSPIAGRVMTVDEDGSSYNEPYNYYGGEDQSGGTGVNFITVKDVTHLRVQGNINEMNAAALMEGMEMRVRSRMDTERTWTGTLSLIDWENPVKNNNDYYYSDEMTSSSKYPFYIELNDTDDLMLGQHVYIETNLDESEAETSVGLMLPSYYVVEEENGSAYVWAANNKDKLEKREVTLGEYDEWMGTYEILDGLTLSDYIAFPMEELTEGSPVERFDPSSFEDDGGNGGGSHGGPVSEAVAMPG